MTVSGKLRRPIAIGIDLTGLGAAILPKYWGYQLLGFKDNDLTKDPCLASGYYRDSFTTTNPAPAGPDGIDVPHTFGPEEPTDLWNITIYAVAGLMEAQGINAANARSGDRTVFTPNLIISGVTASVIITIGTTTGVIDPTAHIQALLDTSVGVNNALFGVLPLGVDNARIAIAAVNTAQLANLAVAAGKLATASVATANFQALAVDAAALATSAVTSTKIASAAVGSAAIASLAVGTAAIQTGAITTALIANAAITNALIANLAVGTAQIQNAAIGTAQIASLAVGTAQIANLAVTDAQIASLGVGKLLAGTISASVTLTSPTLVISGGGVTVNIDGSNLVKVTGGGATNAQMGGNFVSCANLVNGAVAEVLVNSGGAGGGQVTVSDSSGNSTVLLAGTSGSASSGAATLPGNPVGFWTLRINGTNRKVPYYA